MFKKKWGVWMFKVISGGQNGVDLIGLQVAKEYGFETGGTAPKGYKVRTIDGKDKSNKKELKSFGLVESSSSNYSFRTKTNVENSDGTLLFGNMNSVGSKLTINTCVDLGKPYLDNPYTVFDSLLFVMSNNIEVLNIAGNRLKSSNAELMEDTRKMLGDLFYRLKELGYK